MWLTHGPALSTPPALLHVLAELREREPLFHTGHAAEQIAAPTFWEVDTSAQRTNFTHDTGFGLTEFIDMLAFVPSGRARTENEALNAFASEAALRLPDGHGARTQDYVTEFVKTAGRGDWRSLRCSDELGDTKGLQMKALNLK